MKLIKVTDVDINLIERPIYLNTDAICFMYEDTEYAYITTNNSSHRIKEDIDYVLDLCREDKVDIKRPYNKKK
jgi:hypothetical protein